MANIVVSGEKLIARPLNVVQSQFADMAHHEHARVHQDLEVADARPLPDGYRFTSRRRMFGAMQENENEVVRHPDGNSTLSCVAGPNVGLRIAQTFEAQGPDRTLVRIEASLPVSGLRRLLAPLVRKKIQQDLAKALEEDRIDLEERGYPRT